MIINLSDLTEEQQETVRAFAHAVKVGNLRDIEYRSITSNRWGPKSGFKYFDPEQSYRIKKPTADDYLKGHKASGLKVGDKVKVLRIPLAKEGGWNSVYHMSSTRSGLVGLEFSIYEDQGEAGFRGQGYLWPYFVLEKVEPKYRPWKAQEAIGMAVKHCAGDDAFLITGVKEGAVSLNGKSGPDLVGLLQVYTQLDGSPCGEIIKGSEA